METRCAAGVQARIDALLSSSEAVVVTKPGGRRLSLASADAAAASGMHDQSPAPTLEAQFEVDASAHDIASDETFLPETSLSTESGGDEFVDSTGTMTNDEQAAERLAAEVRRSGNGSIVSEGSERHRALKAWLQGHQHLAPQYLNRATRDLVLR